MAEPAPRRLDVELAARGLARSRAHAAQLLAEGVVRLDGAVVRKAALRVGDGHELRLAVDDRYVSRGARKLLAGLEATGMELGGRLVLDVGASTGGFTQVALERGAREVIALDVGRDQLAAVLREDPRVRVVEGVNARELDRERLAAASGTAEAPGAVVGDLSFISLRLVLPALRPLAAADADWLLLVKPQFEVGRGGIRGGIVRDPGHRASAIAGVLEAAESLGLLAGHVLESPIAGADGNREYLVRFHGEDGPGRPAAAWRARIAELAAER
ncbi:TlyA family RNA methyltransferase [Homoserinibacter sp. YIM 151385]|uniref:TlyA family RNA methyltransferase n=1 Tax=Homoserinibacter sp. YIM 151385 TaxID=2985506 RepID=UPI0022F0D089|nr:TlyA family RNA methyltransferase [Homoserinibacter sp. YIM 151385]WBU38855.1 TlyA family RNA methyltransferase [Homoserinibacter sp. YIM 151385]